MKNAFVARWRFGRFDDGQKIVTIKHRSIDLALDPTEFQHGRIPIHHCNDLIADGTLRQFAGVADDRWHANAAIQKCSLVTDPLTRVPAAAGTIKMALRVTTLVIVDSYAISNFTECPLSLM